MIFPISTLPLSSRHRVSQIAFHPSQPFLVVQSHDRSVEIFHIRTEEEAIKMQARRKKRQREKRRGKGIDGEPESAEMEVDGDAETAVSITDLFTPYLVVRADGKIRSFCFPDVRSVRGEVQVSIVLPR